MLWIWNIIIIKLTRLALFSLSPTWSEYLVTWILARCVHKIHQRTVVKLLRQLSAKQWQQSKGFEVDKYVWNELVLVTRLVWHLPKVNESSHCLQNIKLEINQSHYRHMSYIIQSYENYIHLSFGFLKFNVDIHISG